MMGYDKEWDFPVSRLNYKISAGSKRWEGSRMSFDAFHAMEAMYKFSVFVTITVKEKPSNLNISQPQASLRSFGIQLETHLGTSARFTNN